MEVIKDLSRLKEIIDTAESIVFFGGAGTSTESGIADFRSPNGLYNQNRKEDPEKILSHNYFMNRPKRFFDFYKENIVNIAAKPNPGHEFLVNLEKAGKLKAVITQNIDGLHQMAGSENVLELHGSIYQNECVKCHKKYSLDYVLNNPNPVRCIDCESLVKPNVILYGESLDTDIVLQSVEEIVKADLLIVSGTSCSVFPAADLVTYANKKLLINLEKTSKDHICDYVYYGKFAETLNAIRKMND